MEKVNFEDIRVSEKESREKDYSQLESLSGFSRLSEKQQQYIRSSLYIQQRAERGTDAIGASRIEDVPEYYNKFAPNKKFINTFSPLYGDEYVGEDKYKLSQNVIMENYCHGVIQKLEGYKAGELVPKSWNYAGQVHSYEDVEILVSLSEEKGSFPFIVEAWSGKPSENNLSNRVHSALILGRSADGEIMMWEKSGWSMPFQIISMRQSYSAYSACPFWRTRQIAV